MSKRSQALREALEDAALAGAKEMTEFLRLYGGKSAPEVPPDRLKVVHVAQGAVKGYTQWQASQNNMATGLLTATRMVGVSPEQTLEILKSAGMLSESVESSPARLKLTK